MNTEPLLKPNNPKQIQINRITQKIGCHGGHDILCKTLKQIEGAHYICEVCKLKFVKVFRYKSEVNRGRKTGYDTADYIKESIFEKRWTTILDNKGNEIDRRMRPIYEDWKLFDEDNVVSNQKQKTESPTDVIETAILKGIIEKEGNWFHFGDKKFNGRKKLMSGLNINDLQKIENLCHELVSS